MATLTPTMTLMYYQYIPGGSPNITTLTAAQKVLLANAYDLILLKWGGEVTQNATTLLGSPMIGPYTGLAQDLKRVNSSLRVGFYVGGFASPHWLYPHYEWLTTDDLVHSSGGADAINFSAGVTRQALINVNRAATRTKLANAWAAFCAEHDIDVLIFDSFDPSFYSGIAVSVFGLNSSAQEGNVTLDTWWTPGMTEMGAEITAALNRDGRECWIVGIGDATATQSTDVEKVMGYYNSASTDFADGILLENATAMYLSTTEFANHLAAIDLVSLRGKKTFFFFQARYPAPDLTDSTALQRWSLATYLLVKSNYTYYGYWPYAVYEGRDDSNVAALFDSVDWDLDVGTADATWTTNATGNTTIYYRIFTRTGGKKTVAIVNPHASLTGTFNNLAASFKDWHPTTGTPVTVTGGSANNIAAQTGMLLFEQ